MREILKKTKKERKRKVAQKLQHIVKKKRDRVANYSHFFNRRIAAASIYTHIAVAECVEANIQE